MFTGDLMRHLTGPTATWIFLLLLTGLSYLSWLDHSWADPRLIGSAVIVIALIKAWLIGARFMELKGAFWPLRLIFNVWLAGVGAMLLAMLALA